MKIREIKIKDDEIMVTTEKYWFGIADDELKFVAATDTGEILWLEEDKNFKNERFDPYMEDEAAEEYGIISLILRLIKDAE